MRTYKWRGQTHEISDADLTDEQVASRVRITSQGDPLRDRVVWRAHNRILCLVGEKKELQATVDRLEKALGNHVSGELK